MNSRSDVTGEYTYRKLRLPANRHLTFTCQQGNRSRQRCQGKSTICTISASMVPCVCTDSGHLYGKRSIVNRVKVTYGFAAHTGGDLKTQLANRWGAASWETGRALMNARNLERTSMNESSRLWLCMKNDTLE